MSRRTRSAPPIQRWIKRIRRAEDIHQRTWKASFERLDLHPELQRSLQIYIDENEDCLGPEWAASLWLLIAADSADDTLRLEKIYAHLQAGWPPCAVVEAHVGDHLVLKSGDHHRGRRHQQRAVQLHPDYTTGWYHLGLTWQMLGIFSRAAEAWERAMSAAATSPDVREAAARASFNRGVLLLELEGELEAGRRCVERALELMPDYPQARALADHLQRGGLLQKLQYRLRTPPERIP